MRRPACEDITDNGESREFVSTTEMFSLKDNRKIRLAIVPCSYFSILQLKLNRRKWKKRENIEHKHKNERKRIQEERETIPSLFFR